MISVRKQYLNFNVDRGSTFYQTLIVRNASHQAVDITGFTISCQARPNIWSETFVDLDVEVTDADAGEITLGLHYNDTSEMSENAYVYNIEITKSDLSERHRVFEGNLYVAGDATMSPDSSSSSSSSDTTNSSSSSSSDISVTSSSS